MITGQLLKSGKSCPAADTEAAAGDVDAATRFYYDGQGNQVKKTEPDGSYTLYFAGMYEVRKSPGGTVTGTTLYYPAGHWGLMSPICPMAAGGRLGQGAMRVTTVSPSTNNVYYVLSDHLGSTSVVANSNGAAVATRGYYPFGETCYYYPVLLRGSSGSLYTDRLYAGQQLNSYINLMNYRSRWYDSSVGRFISPDSIIPDGNPQSLNRYSYVNNDPINYNDPTGHWPDWGGVWNSVYSFAIQAGDYLGGMGYQYTDDMTFGLVSYVAESLDACPTCNRSDAYHAGQKAGRTAAIVVSSTETVVGAFVAGASLAALPTTGGLSAACAAVTAGGCLPIGGAAISVEAAGVVAGTAVSGYGAASAWYIKNNPLESSGGNPNPWEAKKPFGGTIKNPDGTTTTYKVRNSPGADGGWSRTVIVRDVNGKVISVTHEAWKGTSNPLVDPPDHSHIK